MLVLQHLEPMSKNYLVPGGGWEHISKIEACHSELLFCETILVPQQILALT